MASRSPLELIDQLQMKDLRRELYSHGNYTLAHDFAAFTVPHAVAGEKSGGQGRSFLQVLGTYGPAETNTGANVC